MECSFRRTGSENCTELQRITVQCGEIQHYVLQCSLVMRAWDTVSGVHKSGKWFLGYERGGGGRGVLVMDAEVEAYWLWTWWEG
jgi:hypothetical protein